MLQPPHVRARRRFARRYLGPMLAALIISAGAVYFFGPLARSSAEDLPLAPVAGAEFLPGPGLAFRNCDAAHAAGAAPVRRGAPGYGAHLDADGDGIGCEPHVPR